MSRINLMLFMICLAGLALSGGCENDARMTGKFTEEEMAEIPFAKRDNLPLLSGGLALSVKSETIRVDEIVTPVMKMLDPSVGTDRDMFEFRARPVVNRVVENKITRILLYQEAKKNARDDIDKLLDTRVEVTVNKLRYDQAQQDIADQGMDWEQYRESLKKDMLIEWYYASQILLEDKPVSHSEMLELYEAMQQDGFPFKDPERFPKALKKEDIKWDGFTEFRLIDIWLDKVEVADNETRKDASLRKAAELIEGINKGEKFADLAKDHSHYRASEGGSWTRVTEGSNLEPPYHVLPPLAEKMEVGEVIGPIESDGHVFVLKLERKKKSGVTLFENLQARIEQDIQSARRDEHFGKVIGKLTSEAHILGLDQFVDECVEKAWRRWKSDGSLSSK